MNFDLLWTDKCLLFVLLLCSITIVYSLRKAHVRRSFSILLHRPLALSSGIVLLLFLSIGVLDSIHLKVENKDSESVLDKLLYPLGAVSEKTYSAPLALSLFVSETHIEHGVVEQIHPRLSYVPKTIQTQQDKQEVIKGCLIDAVIAALVIGILCTVLCLLFIPALPSNAQKSTLFTVVTLVFFLTLSYRLSRSFHLLGTGQIGQDIFYFTLKSVRTGLVIGLLTTLFMLPLALFLGIAAGYFGGFVDDVIQYVYTTLSSIPGVLLITASILSLQTYISSHPDEFNTLAKSADARLLALCFILGVTSWTSLCRLLRAETLKLREVDYVMAARALGSTWLSTIRKHLLPNVMHIVIISVVLDFSFLVMAEAVLSYVGVGVSPMTISWGNMINSARLELARDPLVWWPMSAAFIFMFFLVLALNLFADALRDAFDPHQY